MQKMKFIGTLALAALVVCGEVRANAQTADIGQILSGKTVPLTLTLKDMNSDWRVITAGDQNDSSGYMSLIAGMYGGSASNEFFTKGESVMVGGDTYLIGYRQEKKKIDYMALMRSSSRGDLPKSEPMTPDTIIRLALLNLHATNSITNVHPFDLQQEISKSDEAVNSLTEAENQSTSEMNIRQVAYGIIQYMQDNDERLPDMTGPAAMKKLVMPYVKSEKVFYQPGTKIPYMPNAAISKHTLTQIQDPTTMVMLYESKPDKDGKRCVAFVDGHQSFVGAEQWAKLKKACKIP